MIAKGHPAPWRYRAKRFDGDLGLYTFGKRWYDPVQGRWLTLDPAGFVDGMNLYAYVKNNPLLYIDPEGLFAIPLVSLTFGAGVALTPIGWLAVGLAVAGYAAAWSIDKMVESGKVSPQTASAATTLFGGLAGFMITLIPQTAWDLLTGKRVGTSTYIPGVGFVPNELLDISKTREAEDTGRRSSDAPGSPPIRGEDLTGKDGLSSPLEGYDEWRGKGNPKSGKGSWYNPTTGESLHPDLHHLPPDDPHWDYEGEAFPNGAKIYLDGTWAPKK